MTIQSQSKDFGTKIFKKGPTPNNNPEEASEPEKGFIVKKNDTCNSENISLSFKSGVELALKQRAKNWL